MIKIKKIFSLIFVVFSLMIHAQTNKKDSIQIKDTYGFRFGIDLSNPIISLINTDRKSIEIVADYRFNKKIYIAAELGFLDKHTTEDYLDFTTNGQYVKIGANYNLYENWLDMENEVFIGLRYGFSSFNQTLHSYTVFSDNALPTYQNNLERAYNGLSAHWGELVFGMKVEVLNNVFLGATASFKKLVSSQEPEEFQNFYIPGFDRVFLNKGGFGFNYTISYRLPLYKKSIIKNTEEEAN